MKKILYSNITKLAAAALIVVFAALTAFTALNSGVLRQEHFWELLTDENEYIKRPIVSVCDAVSCYGENIDKTLNRYGNELYYYININGTVKTNNDNLDSYTGYKYYYVSDLQNGIYDYSGTPGAEPEDRENIRIFLAVKPEYAENAASTAARLRREVSGIAWQVTAIFVLCLVLFIYLVAVSGRTAETGEIAFLPFDKIYTEFQLLILAALIAAGVMVAALGLTVSFGDFSKMGLKPAVAIGASAVTALFLTSVLSLVRNIKGKMFFKRSLTVRIIKWLLSLCARLTQKIGVPVKDGSDEIKTLLARKTGFIYAALLFVYTFLISVFAKWSFIGFILGTAVFLFACAFVGSRASDYDKIRFGVSNIKGGNLGYKINGIKSEDNRLLAQEINEIGEGLSRSVSEKLKAERMKTELITNVSHDLKTPLTSIINYTSLLEKMPLEAEAADYVKIIARKGEQLKKLTNDLFDISKAQSGNESLNKERLNVKLLIEQSLGEHNSELSSFNLCVKTEEELYINADGKRMSRVVANLISNITKYALKDARVFVSSYSKGNKAVMEFKNTSAYPIDFDAEDIPERFVRGDKSRNTEGSGLGLAIAKSYTELCGGKFYVSADGDLFKAVIEFDKA